ncbi:MAG: 1-acyl-sn-glycerol-3-phosphate acyltransferase [Deltaproteobacteria bacterium]|nr:1-acyl-sn-glycerol-3-phosphate acyltransferase [Deltaproteobacteria bacterium]
MVSPATDTSLARVLTHDPPPERVNAADASCAQPPQPPRERHLGPARVVEERQLSALSAALRITFAVCVYAVCAPIVLAALLVCLPSRKARIKIGNVTGQFTGGLAVWLTGSAYHVRGVEHLDRDRPAIYVANHASLLDIALGIWLAPVGTVGVAKKEIIFYPFFGQYYWLSGHLRIDRKNARQALKSLQVLCALVKRHALSVFIWPEGHRAPDGRLRSFKRGAFRLALETKLPIVPVVIAGSHRAWPAKAVRLTRTNVAITCLPAIDTTDWTSATLGQHVKEIEALFAAALPPEQRPLPPA